MTTTLDFTPAVVHLALLAGDDITIRLMFSTDAPTGGVFVGEWDAAVVYKKDDIVEDSSVFYAALAASENIAPGTDVTKWVALTPLDLTGYTDWAAQIRTSADEFDDFDIDDSDQASSIIELSMDGETLRDRLGKSRQRWDIQAIGPDTRPRTFFGGHVSIKEDATQ